MIHSERSFMFKTINKKQLHFFMNQWDQALIAKWRSGSGGNHSLCYSPQREEKIWNLPICIRNLNLMTWNSKKPFSF